MTSVKGYVGLVAQQTEPGDVIAVVFGAKCPLILRPTGNGRHRVVTPSYIQGCVDGEIVAKLDEGLDDVKPQTITIV